MGKSTKRDSGPGHKGPWSDELQERLEQAIDQFHGDVYRHEKGSIKLSKMELYVLLNDALGHIVSLETPTPRDRTGITWNGLLQTFHELMNADPNITKTKLIDRAAAAYNVEPATIYRRMREFRIVLDKSLK